MPHDREPGPDRKGAPPHTPLGPFRGILQADGYAGYARLYDRGVTPRRRQNTSKSVVYRRSGDAKPNRLLSRLGVLRPNSDKNMSAGMFGLPIDALDPRLNHPICEPVRK